MSSLSTSQSGSATVTRVNASDTAQTALQRNGNREGLMIYNDSDANLLVHFGGTASTTEFSVKLSAGGYYESGLTVYQGALSLVWDAAGTGAALITELEV